MLNLNEIDFVFNELSNYADHVHNILEDESKLLSDKMRSNYEEKLITCVGITTKLKQSREELEQHQARQNYPAKVLIVDDMESMRKLAKAIITDIGFGRIHEAESATKALKMIEKTIGTGTPYTLIVSGWEMPNMTGFELLRKVRLNKHLSSTPFFLLTSVQDPKSIGSAIDSGVTGYIVKPVNPKILAEKLSPYLNM